MPTVNKFLESLTKEQVIQISEKYLRGWVNLQSDYKIMLRGLNRKREAFGLSRINRDQVFDYRDAYVKQHFSYDQRVTMIDDYLSTHRMNEQRSKGILLFNCRFDLRYVKAFRSLIGKARFDELSEKRRVSKMMSTQKFEYGGVGLASKQSLRHAKQTTFDRYGVSNPMQVDAFKNKLFTGLLQKVGDGMELYRKSHDINDIRKVTFNSSPTELLVLDSLCKRFDYNDVFYQYGVLPKDDRYPFSCDFYVKSKDLFIELNYYYAHGNHWFDENSFDDQKRLSNLKLFHTKDSYERVLNTWTKKDVLKRHFAQSNHLNYLVFWKYPLGNVDCLKLQDLNDLYDWLVNYDGDFESFVKTHPENTY